MSAVANLTLAVRLYREDPGAHLGDVAVLKSDAFGADIREDLRDQLAPVEGYLPDIDLDALGAYPEGSFGHAYAQWMRAHDLDVFRLTDAVSPEMRARQTYGIRYAITHDMFHVLLGFDPSYVGEMGVLAFAHGQGYGRVVTVQVWFAWVFWTVLSGFRLSALREAYRRGRAMGEAAPFLLGMRLEERFAEPLDALRAEFRLTEVA